jgi:hypothetical protein
MFENTWQSGAEAQEEARRQNEWYKSRSDRFTSYANYRYRVRKVVDTDSDNYVAREMAKGHNFIDMSRVPKYVTIPNYYLAHIHPDDKNKVRFFPSVENAVEGRWLVVGLPRFLSHYMDMEAEDAENYLVEVGYYSGKSELKFLTKAEEIVSAYRNGPTSCMNDPDEYPLPDIHPATVYASPDLALAVLDRGGGDGVSARTLCCPARKIYGRVYGHAKLLESKLKELGYRKTTAKSAWEGLRIQKIEYTDGDDEGDFLCPYIDVSATVRQSRDGKFLRLAGDKGTHTAQNCSGIAYPKSYWE